MEGRTDIGSAVVQYDMQIKKISAVYKDRLLVDYEPEKVVGFSPRQAYTISTSNVLTASMINIFS